MKVVRASEVTEYQAPGQSMRRARILANPEIIGIQKVAVGSASYGPGMSAPFHKHAGEEIIVVVGGNGKFTSRKEEVEAATGDLIFFEPGEEHKLENTGSQTLRFIFIYTQPGDEQNLKKNWIPLKS